MKNLLLFYHYLYSRKLNVFLTEGTRDKLLRKETPNEFFIFHTCKSDLQEYIKRVQESNISQNVKAKKMNNILELFKVIDFYYYEKIGENLKIYTVFEYTVNPDVIKDLKDQCFTLIFEKPFEFIIENVSCKNPVTLLKLKKLCS